MQETAIATGKTLLAHLSPRFTERAEDIAVESLGYILSRSKAARDALEDVLRNGGAEVGPISRVTTQVSEAGTRPDIVCYDRSGAERVLIEAKFWAGLTDNQPVAYLKRLPDDRPSALLVIAPTARFESLWPELQRRVAEDGTTTIGESTKESGLFAATTGERQRLLMTSWTALLDRMASRATDTRDMLAENDIRQLRGLAERADQDALLPLRREQLGPEFPRLVLHLNRLVDDAFERGRKDGWIGTEGGLRATPQSWGYGRYMRIAGVGVWFGVDFRRWSQFRETPLWVDISFWSSAKERRLQEEAQRKLDEMPQKNPPDFVEEDHAICINLPVGVEYAAVLDDVVRQLKRIADLLAADE